MLGHKPFDTLSGVIRFSVISAAILALTALGIVIFRLWFGNGRDEGHGLFESELQLEALVFLSAGVALHAFWRRRPQESLIAAGALFFALVATLSWAHASTLQGASQLIIRPSWLSVFILLFVLLVPGPLIYHFALLTFTTFCTPLLVAISILSHPGPKSGGPGQHSPKTLGRRLTLSMQPTWICVIVGVAIAVHRDRDRRRWYAVIEQLRDARGQLQQLGAYRLERQLGSGGMGEVWQATHQVLARPAAIKLISAQFLREQAGDEATLDRFLHRFQQEAKLTARLTSPHTVQVYDYGRTDDGQIYYVMELLQGVDFAQVVGRLGPQPQERVVDWLIQICDSLGEAHSLGLIHRDIKPANLFLCRQGVRREVVKVLDFGLAITRRSTGGDMAHAIPGTISGSPHFMAPEQVKDEGEVDGRTDLYALGCVAWYLLTGRNVFHDTSHDSLLEAHVDQPPKRLSEVCTAPLDPRLEELVNRLLAKDPNDRPSSAGALADELIAFGMPTPTSQLLVPELLEMGNDFLSEPTMVLVRPLEQKS
jgi:serine/threonine protein kinase